jgi:hypothetical protein
VLVSLRATGVRDLPMAWTDGDGFYELRELPPARYTLTASRGGFVTLEYGQRRPNEPGRPIELTDGEKLQGIDLLLPAGGVITGQVVDAAGEPLAGAVVQVWRPRYVDGLRETGQPAGSPDVTDDLGRFRLFGLPQGGFLLSVVAPDPTTPTPRCAAHSDPPAEPGSRTRTGRAGRWWYPSLPPHTDAHRPA